MAVYVQGGADLDHFAMTDVRWEESWEPGHRGLIYANNAHDIIMQARV